MTIINVADIHTLTLDIPPWSFNEKKKYRFTLQGATSGNALGVSVVERSVNAAPHNGTCTVDIASGIVFYV